jgi:hypothetical protein
MTLDNNGKWEMQKKRAMLRGNQTLIAVDRCWAQAPCINVMTLENIYGVLVESVMLYWAEMWGIHKT